jgi:hypothetical protein
LLQRCSRPLCRSQTTHPPTTTTPKQRDSGRRRPQATNQPADPSGPNSVPNHPPPHPTHQVPHPHHPHRGRTRAVLRQTGHEHGSFIDDSTSEHHHGPPHGRRWRGACAP